MASTKQVRVFEDAGELTIEIGPLQQVSAFFEEGLIALIWIALSIQVARTVRPLLAAGHWLLASPYVLVCSFYAVCSVLRFLWCAWGQETIVAKGALLSVTRGIGWLAATRVYPLDQVRDLHVVVRDSRVLMRMWYSHRIVGGCLGFAYGKRPRRMADRIDESEARRLLRCFRDWLPAENWTPVLGLG